MRARPFPQRPQPRLPPSPIYSRVTTTTGPSAATPCHLHGGSSTHSIVFMSGSRKKIAARPDLSTHQRRRQDGPPLGCRPRERFPSGSGGRSHHRTHLLIVKGIPLAFRASEIGATASTPKHACLSRPPWSALRGKTIKRRSARLGGKLGCETGEEGNGEPGSAARLFSIGSGFGSSIKCIISGPEVGQNVIRNTTRAVCVHNKQGCS